MKCFVKLVLFQLFLINSVLCFHHPIEAFHNVLVNSTNVIKIPGPIINTQYGRVQGTEEFYKSDRSVYAYRGIRFAAPPTGNLRFRQAVPPTPWSNIFQADTHGSQCPQLDFLVFPNVVYTGNEDCLFLNIATPTNRNANHAVVVNFHGGGLHFGNADMDMFRADFINEQDVVYVAPQYRLNVLGFLNTEDSSAPGNYAIKDMIMALRWVRDNIANFGGDPNNVSIMGISGGAVAVHALVVSPISQGLFHRALSHSGSLFNVYAFSRNPRASAVDLARRLGISFTSMQNLVDQLRQVPARNLVEANADQHFRMPLIFEEFAFSPSIDALNSNEPRVLPTRIEDLVNSGNINRVPYMVGFNSMESLYAIVDVALDPTIFQRFNANPFLLVPTEWNLQPNSNEANEVIAAFRNVYFNGASTITNDHVWGWTQYVSDREFIFGATKAARLHARQQNLHNFIFSYSGTMSLVQQMWGLMEFNEAIHGDDALYLFHVTPFPVNVPVNDPALTVQKRLVNLWTNFFKFGDPTAVLNDLITVRWPRYGANSEFMNIGLNLQTGTKPLASRMDVWMNFDQRFNN